MVYIARNLTSIGLMSTGKKKKSCFLKATLWQSTETVHSRVLFIDGNFSVLLSKLHHGMSISLIRYKCVKFPLDQNASVFWDEKETILQHGLSFYEINSFNNAVTCIQSEM